MSLTRDEHTEARREGLKILIERIKKFEDGDILEFMEIESVLFSFYHHLKEQGMGDNRLELLIQTGFDNISALTSQKDFLDSVGRFLEAILEIRRKEGDISHILQEAKEWLEETIPGEIIDRQIEKQESLEITIDNSGQSITETSGDMIEPKNNPEKDTISISENPEDTSTYSIIQKPEILETFYHEIQEHLQNAEVSLLELEHDPENDESINSLFRTFHTIKGSSAFLELKTLEEVGHELENLLSQIRNGSIIITQEIIDLMFEMISGVKALVEVLPTCDYNSNKISVSFAEIDIEEIKQTIQSGYKMGEQQKIGSILMEMGKINSDDVEEVLELQKKKGTERFGQLAIESKKLNENELSSAIAKQRKDAHIKNSYVKVSSSRLNHLVNLIGELVVVQSVLENSISQEQTGINRLGTITTEIKNLVLAMGMVSISDLFNRLRVTIRNTARELGKSVNIDIYGEDTEIDRNLMEALYDPLVHIVRNAVDHGIETPEERESCGKAIMGKITLRSEHTGDGIEITVSDDGNGLDTGRILTTAYEKGVISKEEVQRLEEGPASDIFPLIFHPGLSTKQKVSEISGRGVGMDVVKRNIQDVRGRIDLISEKGKGTTLVIRLPLTLAIIDGFVFRTRGKKFIFPFRTIQEIVVSSQTTFHTSEDGSTILELRETYIPVYTAEKILFGETPETIPRCVILLTHMEKTVGVAVDEVMGKQEIVIKNLNKAIRHLKIFSGGTVFGDGSIGFIIDLEVFFRSLELPDSEVTLQKTNTVVGE